MNTDSICYKIHSVSPERDISLSEARLSKNFKRLNSKSVAIYDKDSLDLFLSNNQDFKINNKSILRYTEVGLWASTYLCLNDFLNSKYENVIVLEDDVLVKESFSVLLKDYLNLVPKDFDCFMAFVPDNVFHTSGYDEWFDENKYYTESKDIWVAHQTWSTGCMVINKVGAKKILNYIRDGIFLPLDIFILGGRTLHNPRKNARILKVYSLSRYAEKITELINYPSQIQNGKYVIK